MASKVHDVVLASGVLINSPEQPSAVIVGDTRVVFSPGEPEINTASQNQIGTRIRIGEEGDEVVSAFGGGFSGEYVYHVAFHMKVLRNRFYRIEYTIYQSVLPQPPA